MAAFCISVSPYPSVISIALFSIKSFAHKALIMAQPTTFMTLPPELRERVYEFVALANPARQIRTIHNEASATAEHKISTSAVTATGRLVHVEYEDVARKATTSFEFAVMNMDVRHIIDYFHRHVDSKYLAILQQNKATICIDLIIRDDSSAAWELSIFYQWALFLLRTKLEVIYRGEPETWMAILEAASPNFVEQSTEVEERSQEVRGNVEGIRNVARAFDKAMWTAYPDFSRELQVRRHRAFDSG